MALAEPIDMIAHVEYASMAANISITSAWVTAIDAGGMDAADNASITNPTTQITATDHRIIRRNSGGTTLLVRLVYDATLTAITNPVIAVFGRTNGQDWQRLLNNAGATAATLTTDSADVSNGTYKFTHPSTTDHAWDCMGCDEFLIGVQTAMSGSTGTATTAYLQAKC